MSATTSDEKYEFTMGAYNFNDEVEVDPDTLDRDWETTSFFHQVS